MLGLDSALLASNGLAPTRRSAMLARMEGSPPADGDALARKQALDARDRALLERFLAGDAEASRKVVEILNADGYKVACRFWPWTAKHWAEERGAMFELLWRYRAEGKLRLDEPLYFLAQRLLRQVGRKAGADWAKAQLDVSLETGSGSEDPGEEAGEAAKIQAEASVAAAAPSSDPERALAAKELLEWFANACERLSAKERETFDASMRVDDGDAPDLATALGVPEATARVRRFRMRAALRALARADGMEEIVKRFEARRPKGESRRRESAR